MVVDPYEPIDCAVHDRLEAWCVKRTRCFIRIARDEGCAQEVEARIQDIFVKGGEEFMLLDTGDVVRLDRIVDIREGPGRNAG